MSSRERRLTCRLCVCVVVFAVRCVGASSVEAAAGGGCVPAHASRLVQRGHVVVYQVSRGTTIACKTRTHQRTPLLLMPYAEILIPRPTVVTRTRIIFVSVSLSDDDDAPASYVESVPFGHGAGSVASPSVPYDYNPPGASPPNAAMAVPQVVALANGAFAWLKCPSANPRDGDGVSPRVGAEYYRCDTSHARTGPITRQIYLQSASRAPAKLLDTSSGMTTRNEIVSGSLRANAAGTVLQWKHGDDVHRVAIGHGG